MPLGAAGTREVHGGVYPLSNDGLPPGGAEVSYPMPFVDLVSGGETLTTDAGGNLLTCVDGEVSTALSGQFVEVIDACGAISETTSGEVLDLGTSGGTDCAVPAGASAGNTHAARTAFHVVGDAALWASGYLPDNPWLHSQLLVRVNQASSCGATGNPSGLTFFTSGGGCSNTGELAGVLVHEWGHGLDGADATAGRSDPGEGIADLYAALWGNASCIGRNFRPGVDCGGYGDPCTQCTGVRDVDWANRASGVPHDVAFIDAACASGTTNGPCGGSVHCEGAAYSEAVWDLWQRDLTAAPFGLNVDTARELTTRLTFLGAGAVDTWFNCVPGTGTGDGCNADGGYLAFLAADDDDGDLTNGTPHMSAIAAAFARHGIACPSPVVQNGGCAGAPTAAPGLTVTARDRGAMLSWNAVSGAESYQVFRHKPGLGCGGGAKLRHASGSPFFDDGLRNGEETCYYVIPVGAGDTCVGPASDCVCTTPEAGPHLARDAAVTGTVELLTGDGDPFLDNCEEATVTVGVENVGVESLSNVRVVAVRAPNHPQLAVTSPLPLTVASSLPVCDRAQAAIAFQAAGLVSGEVELEIDVTSDPTSPKIETWAVRLRLPGVESDLASFGSRTFGFEGDSEGWSEVQGTFERASTGAGSGGGSPATDTYFASSAFLGDQCDHLRSPVLTLSPASTLTLWTNFNIEDDGGTGSWYDRANLGLFDPVSGERGLLEPSGGRDYQASGSGGTCGTTGQRGWAGSHQTWATSTFDAASLGAAGIAGDLVQLDLRYGTDGALHLDGFRLDEVTLTDVEVQVADAQPDVCGPPGLIFADGFESGDAGRWSSSSP